MTQCNTGIGMLQRKFETVGQRTGWTIRPPLGYNSEITKARVTIRASIAKPQHASRTKSA
jgi:hypothetical protein